MGNPQASACPVTLNGTEYSMSPLTDRSIGEVNNRIKRDIIMVARESLGDEQNLVIIDATMKAAMSQAMLVDWMSDPERWMNGYSLIHMFFLCIKENTERTFEDFSSDLMADEKGIDSCYDAFGIVHPFMSGKAKTAVKPKKDQSKNQSIKKPSTKL